MIARHGIPFVRNSIAASVNGQKMKKNAVVSAILNTPKLDCTTNCSLIRFASTSGLNLHFTSASDHIEYDKIGTPSYLVTTSLFITLGENVGDLWLETLLTNCYFRLETLTLNGNEDVLL